MQKLSHLFCAYDVICASFSAIIDFAHVRVDFAHARIDFARVRIDFARASEMTQLARLFKLFF